MMLVLFLNQTEQKKKKNVNEIKTISLGLISAQPVENITLHQ